MRGVGWKLILARFQTEELCRGIGTLDECSGYVSAFAWAFSFDTLSSLFSLLSGDYEFSFQGLFVQESLTASSSTRFFSSLQHSRLHPPTPTQSPNAISLWHSTVPFTHTTPPRNPAHVHYACLLMHTQSFNSLQVLQRQSGACRTRVMQIPCISIYYCILVDLALGFVDRLIVDLALKAVFLAYVRWCIGCGGVAVLRDELVGKSG